MIQLTIRPLECRSTDASVSVRRTTAAGAIALADAPTFSPSAEAGCNRGKHWQVQKFGGTCVSAAERISAVAKLIVEGSKEEGIQQVITTLHPLHYEYNLRATDSPALEYSNPVIGTCTCN